MNHKGTAPIQTDRLILRRFELGDAEAAYRNWTSDNKVTKFLRWPTHASVSVTRDSVEKWIENYSRNDFYQWAIVLKEINEPIGTISAVDMDERTSKVHIGYCIGSKWWHKGITSEAFAAVIPFFFKEVKANRIESQHDPNNPNSGRVMEKCGLVFEGTHRQADFNNQGIVDAAMYALLASDFAEKHV